VGTTTDRITLLLKEVAVGADRASDALFEAVYVELRKLAAARLRRGGPAQTIQATELVHEAYLRLIDRDRCDDAAGERRAYENRRHYFFAAARAIHDIVVERIRRRKSLKRGGDRMRLDASLLDLPAETRDATRVLEIADALDRLRAVDPERADLVLLRYFGGLSCEEVADILGISLATANRRWRFARAWLAAELDPGP
jgi:RNA polymerase sigma factor (TIGR02999 family)